MDKGPRQLNQAFVEAVVRARFFQPKVFKHFMCFEIPAGIEAIKKGKIPRVTVMPVVACQQRGELELLPAHARAYNKKAPSDSGLNRFVNPASKRGGRARGTG